jgi:predicted porin
LNSERLHIRLFYLLLFFFSAVSCLHAAETDTKAKPAEVQEQAVDRETDASEDPMDATTAEIKDKNKDKPAAVQEQAVDREQGADEDPLDATVSDIKDKPPFYIHKDHTSFGYYASIRTRYTQTGNDGALNDGGSRAGINAEFQFRPRFWLLGRAEVGFNIFDTVNNLLGGSNRLGTGDEKVSSRLLYAGLQTSNTTATYGKNWSSYYQVSGITDRFASFGGDASGTYNALTDGGPTGTGRADGVLQGRFSVKAPWKFLDLQPFKLNIQVQDGQTIPQAGGEDYGYTLGLSALLLTTSEKFIGIAYNQATIDKKELPALAQYGIAGDAKALILGTRRFGDKYYLGSNLARLENHETSDAGHYFNGWGWEFFSSYNFSNRWWVIGGWNILEPDSKQPLIGDYRIRYGVIGLRYTFDQFRRMVYTEIRLDDSLGEDGTSPGNTYTVGIRWAFPKNQ